VISQAVSDLYPDVLVTPSLLTATTDTRHYIDLADDLYRFHGMMMLSSQTSSIHGTDEFISIDSYEKTIAVARRMMELGSAP
jgi:carboxypeptidase PM20D1